MKKIYSIIIMLGLITLAHGASSTETKPIKSSHRTSGLQNLNMHAILPSSAHRAAAAKLALINSPKEERAVSIAHTQPTQPEKTTDPLIIAHDGHPGDHTLHISHQSIEHNDSIYG